jgi:hypothetical protein
VQVGFGGFDVVLPVSLHSKSQKSGVQLCGRQQLAAASQYTRSWLRFACTTTLCNSRICTPYLKQPGCLFHKPLCRRIRRCESNLHGVRSSCGQLPALDWRPRRRRNAGCCDLYASRQQPLLLCSPCPRCRGLHESSQQHLRYYAAALLRRRHRQRPPGAALRVLVALKHRAWLSPMAGGLSAARQVAQPVSRHSGRAQGGWRPYGSLKVHRRRDHWGETLISRETR